MSPEPLCMIPIGPQEAEAQSHALISIVNAGEIRDPCRNDERYIMQAVCSLRLSDRGDTLDTRVAEQFSPAELAAVIRFLKYHDQSEAVLTGHYGQFELEMCRSLDDPCIRVRAAVRLQHTRVSPVSLATSQESISSTIGKTAGFVRCLWMFNEQPASTLGILTDSLRILSEFI